MSSEPGSVAGDDRLGTSTILALVAMALAVFAIANDFVALSVALPQMERDFDTDINTVQWVINAYALVFGVFIVTGGRLADMVGRKRMFFVGAAIFAVFSVLAGAGQEAWQVIAGRAIMGIGGAIMFPAVLGMTYEILPASKAGLAGGLILGVAGLGNATGPLLGGVLTEELSWRWVLFINLPIAAVAIAFVAAYVHLPPPEETDERIDVPGVLTLSVGLVALLLALDQALAWGWTDWRIIGLFAVAATFIVALPVVEHRAGRNALVPADVLKNREFAAATVAVLLMSATFFVALLYLPQFMEKFLGYSPLEAGLGLLPLMVTYALCSFVAGWLYERLGAKLMVSVGAACLPAGLFLVSLIGDDSGYAALLPGMVLLGIGVGIFYSSVTTAAVTALDPSRASLAGGIVYMAQVAGGAVGLGLTTTIVSSVALDHVQDDVLGRQLTDAQAHLVDDVLAGTDSARELLAQAPGAGAQLEQLARDAFIAGFQTGFRVCGALALVGFLIALFFVGGRLRGKEAPAAERDQEAARA